MRVTLESTTKMVTVNGVPARIWEGKTDSGIPVHAFITRIAAPDRPEIDFSQFERELRECAKPSPEVQAIDARLLL